MQPREAVVAAWAGQMPGTGVMACAQAAQSFLPGKLSPAASSVCGSLGLSEAPPT